MGYSLKLCGNLIELKRTLADSPALDDDAGLQPFYDREGAIPLPNGQWAYPSVFDAQQAYYDARQRRRASNALSRRGRITQFSRRSRYRLLKLTNTFSERTSGVMVTFTYRQNMTDYATAKKHLSLALLWMKRHYPGAAALWRMENQERGAIHYHIMLLSDQSGVWVNIARLREYWQGLTGDDSYPNVKWISNRRRALAYVSKYIAKVDQNEPAAQDAFKLVQEPYSDIPNPGRFWGLYNRAAAPIAPVIEYAVPEKCWFEILELRRMVTRWSRSIARRHPHNRYLARFSRRLPRSISGFTLFAPASECLRWIERFTEINSRFRLV